jgi:hypothetical protein
MVVFAFYIFDRHGVWHQHGSGRKRMLTLYQPNAYTRRIGSFLLAPLARPHDPLHNPTAMGQAQRAAPR